MKTKHILMIILLTISSLLFVACSPAAETAVSAAEAAEHEEGDHHANDDHMDDDHHMDNDHMDDDHMADMAHMHVAAPTEFANLTNPFADDHESLEAGEELFATYCATCHGETGAGDGPAAEGLDPQPANLGDGMMMSDLSDGYLFWRITKGGTMEPFNSAMPAWEDGLTEEQRWQLITFIRSLSSESGKHMDEHEHSDSH